MTKPLCIYHGNCADGFTAAWAVWKRFGDEFEYHPGIYQNLPPDVTGRDVVLVDFSYKRAVLEQMAKTARSILVLDHHKSAEGDLKGLGVDMSGWSGALAWGRYLDCVAQDHMENANINGAVIYQLFDMERSGAGLTWDFFHPERRRPHLVSFVEDRDLWRFHLPHSREVNALIFSHAYSFENWDRLDLLLSSNEGIASAIDQGEAIERKHHKDVAELVKVTRRELCIGGHWVPVANLPYTLTSDAGSLMCAPYASANLQGEMVTPPFAACYWDTPEGRVFSLRSRGDFDVSEIAKMYGGGGHKNASGFRVPFGHELTK